MPKGRAQAAAVAWFTKDRQDESNRAALEFDRHQQKRQAERESSAKDGDDEKEAE